MEPHPLGRQLDGLDGLGVQLVCDGQMVLVGDHETALDGLLDGDGRQSHPIKPGPGDDRTRQWLSRGRQQTHHEAGRGRQEIQQRTDAILEGVGEADTGRGTGGGQEVAHHQGTAGRADVDGGHQVAGRAAALDDRHETLDGIRIEGCELDPFCRGITRQGQRQAAGTGAPATAPRDGS